MATYSRAVGIDLGTTNSAIAMLSPDGDELVLWEDRFKRKTYPSVLGTDGSRLISGWEAWNRRGISPFPIHSIKRKMGSGQSVALGERAMTPAEVSAEILRGLTEIARPKYETLIENHSTRFDAAVITVPAYFDAPQIDDTLRAGQAAGLNVLGLLQEPTAAAMYHAWKHAIEDGVFLVFDLGGGTFDVSVIRSIHGEYQVLGIDGDNFLGGDDFDRRLAEHFRKHLVAQGYALDLDINDPADAAKFLVLTRVAQEVKEALSTSQMQYVARRDMFSDHEGNPVTLELEYARSEFEMLIQDFLDQAIGCCHAAIQKATERSGVVASEIDHVLMVGGSTRIPAVRALVHEAFCTGQTRATELRVDEPDTAVALGAALRAASLGGLTIEDAGFSAQLTSSTYTHEASIDVLGMPSVDTHAVALMNQADDIVSVVRTRPGEPFEFEEIPLPDLGTHRFVLDFTNPAGDSVARLPFAVTRGAAEAIRPTGSALSNPTVLAKDIVLEVVRDGRSERQVLLAHGIALPAFGEFTFFTADKSGAVILRLYQSRFPIRTIHLDLPAETPVGTPVSLKVSVEENMTTVAEGDVAGQRFWAQIEPPPAREVRAWEDIERMLSDVDQTATKLWGRELSIFRDVTTPLVAGIRETVRTDPDKLQALVLRLEDLMDRFRNTDNHLTPGWQRFESTLDNIRRVVWKNEATQKLGMGTDEWNARLAKLEQEARNAYDVGDQHAWTRVFNQAQALWESLVQDEYRFASVKDPRAHVEELGMVLKTHIDSLRSDFHAFPVSPQLETAALQRAELARLAREVDERVERPLERMDLTQGDVVALKPELDRLFEAVQMIRRQFDRLPTLGLVSR